MKGDQELANRPVENADPFQAQCPMASLACLPIAYSKNSSEQSTDPDVFEN